MKLTTNYIVYLNADNKVQCAKCRVTGKFIKRSIAQKEYSTEYAYNHSLVTLLIMFAMFLWDSLNSSKMALECQLIAINEAMQTAYKQHDYVLFKQLNRKRFELIKDVFKMNKYTHYDDEE